MLCYERLMGKGAADNREPLRMLNRDDIESNLRAVGEKLAAKQLIGEIMIVGGAFMLLVVKNRDATKDIDAYLVAESQAIRQAVEEVATERSLASDWLNDAVKGFMYSTPSTKLIEEYPGLKVYAPNPEYVFAMKAEASRLDSSDIDDLRALRNLLKLKTLDEALEIVEKYIPSKLRSPKTALVLETIFSEEAV